MASVPAGRGRRAEAVPELGHVLSGQPQHFGALLALAQIASQRREFTEARRYHEAAARAARTLGQEIEATIALTRLLATCPVTARRDVARAIEIAETANDATGRRYPSLLDVLAEAYAAAGRTDDAIATATEALDLARQVNAPGLAEEFERKLNRYRASLSPG